MVRLLTIVGLSWTSLLALAESESVHEAIVDEADVDPFSEACVVACGDGAACEEAGLALHQIRAWVHAGDDQSPQTAPLVPNAMSGLPPLVGGDDERLEVAGDIGAASGMTAAEEAALLQRRASQNGTVRGVMESLLGKDQMVVGYHQTSIPICHKILQEGFRPGKRGWCGGAIYFSDTQAGTYGEAVGKDSHQGCIIQATINVGRVKMLGPTCENTMNGGKLASMGYDSITFNDNEGTGQQIVIYDPKRVVSMKIVHEDPNWHGPPQMQNPNP